MFATRRQRWRLKVRKLASFYNFTVQSTETFWCFSSDQHLFLYYFFVYSLHKKEYYHLILAKSNSKFSNLKLFALNFISDNLLNKVYLNIFCEIRKESTRQSVKIQNLLEYFSSKEFQEFFVNIQLQYF
jgi:hypothetical protein